MFELKVVSFFSSAHSLRGYKGKCESTHGHNWQVEFVVKSTQLDDCGLVIDFKELKKILAIVLDKLDHKDLNQIDSFKEINPSSENIARFIYLELKPLLSKFTQQAVKVTVWEQRDSAASFYEE